jgi:hypothetical protein
MLLISSYRKHRIYVTCVQYSDIEGTQIAPDINWAYDRSDGRRPMTYVRYIDQLNTSHSFSNVFSI